jgi:hypothetical protein
MATIEEIEARRAERRARESEERDAQYALDLEALDAAEEEHGHSRVAHLAVPFEPGLPTMVICRAPRPVELKRYKDALRKDRADMVAATDQLAVVCRIYPDRDIWERLLERRPGLLTQLGGVAAKLALGVEAEEGKG